MGKLPSPERAAAKKAKERNGNSSAPPPPFERGSSNGSGRRRKKGRNKSKKNRSANAASAAADAAREGRPISPNGEHKHARENSADVRSSRPQKKQRSAPASSLVHDALYIVFFLIGMAITMPLLFATCTRLGCGGGRATSLIDGVVARRARGETAHQLLESLQKASISGGSTEDKGNGAADGAGDATGEMSLHESMCQVSSIAIGSFVHHLPHAQVLVLRNPFRKVDISSPSLEDGGMIGEDNVDKKKRRGGLFRRVLSKRKKRQREDESESEGIKRKNPLRHMLEGASVFLHHKKGSGAKKRREKRGGRKDKRRPAGREEDTGGTDVEVDWKKWKYAMTDDYDLTPGQTGLVTELAARVTRMGELRTCADGGEGDGDGADCREGEALIPSLSEGTGMPDRPLQERLDDVPWGGPGGPASTRWWGRGGDGNTPLSRIDGGRLLAAYLRIMKWPKDMRAKYPFRLCARGCDAEVSILHTLEWREKYKPWCVSGAAVLLNRMGFVYHRGHSRAGRGLRRGDARGSVPPAAGHSMVYYRPGRTAVTDSDLYGRAMIHVLDAAVADSLVRSDGSVGRFNVVMDCEGMTASNSPAIADVKRLFSVLQDHFPDRLGVLLAANLSGLARMLMKMVLPFVTEDVRAKIHIVPNGEEERREMLSQFVDLGQVPDYLGGEDGYRFDAEEHYRGTCVLSDEEVREYKTTMPYHA